MTAKLIMKRTAFFISDGTGITAEALGHSLLTQFEHLSCEKITIPYVDTVSKAENVVARINEIARVDGNRPLIFATLVNSEIRSIIAKSDGFLIDFFKTFLDQLEAELSSQSSHNIGRMHGLVNYDAYMTRINAVNYSLSHDDGLSPKNYDQADLILVGVSRCGKTPTCLYLALQFGIYAANYPLTEEDLAKTNLPVSLVEHRQRLFGLTIEPDRLHSIREERRPNSRYASLAQCKLEVQKAEYLLQQEKIPFLSTTTRSIEEIATSVLATTGVKRRV